MRSRWHDRDIIQAATQHALKVREPTNDRPGLTDYGAAHAAAALALVLACPDHPNHAREMAEHLPPTGVENGRPYDVYCEDCGHRVQRKGGAWWCDQHRDLGRVKFVARPAEHGSHEATAMPSTQENDA